MRWAAYSRASVFSAPLVRDVSCSSCASISLGTTSSSAEKYDSLIQKSRFLLPVSRYYFYLFLPCLLHDFQYFGEQADSSLAFFAAGSTTGNSLATRVVFVFHRGYYFHRCRFELVLRGRLLKNGNSGWDMDRYFFEYCSVKYGNLLEPNTIELALFLLRTAKGATQ